MRYFSARISGVGLALLIWTLEFAPLGVLHADWPRFRGPNGAGTDLAAKIPAVWKPENTLWKVALPGEGSSSPCVVGERIFISSAEPGGKSRRLDCFDLRGGAMLWGQRTELAPTGKHKKNSHATATPASDGQRVVVLFTNNQSLQVLCYSLAGHKLWQMDLGRYDSANGSGSSPIFYQNLVIVPNDQDGPSSVVAMDKETGKIVWQATRPTEKTTAFSTPFVLARPEGDQLIFSSSHGISALEPTRGKEVWFCDRFDKRSVGSPVEASGLIVASCGQGGHGEVILGTRFDGSGDVTRTHVAWEERQKVPYCTTPLVVGDHLFLMVDILGLLRCLETKTGKSVWDQRLRGGHLASPIRAGDQVILVSEEGEITLVAADPRICKILGRNQLKDRFQATPAVAGNRLIFRGAQFLWCVGEQSLGTSR